MKKISKVSAPGKLILSGEHAVVYSHPALSMAVGRRLYIKNGKITSNIPIGAGMGSSAAFAVAKSALRVGTLDREKINEMAYKMEIIRHGKPSGADNTVVTYGGFLWYRKETENFKTFKMIIPKRKLPKVYLLNTGKPEESTKEMVKFVADRLLGRKSYFDSVFGSIERVTRNFLGYLTGDNNLELGSLIRENEALLERLGVVSVSTKKIIRKIEKLGGAAKISGAGGIKKASGIIMIYHKDPEKLLKFAKKNNLNLFSVKMGEEGVRIE